MSPRIPFYKYSDAIKPLIELNTYVRQSGLETSLIELVLLRVSQINGCAYCIDMHSKDARAEGESEQRLYLLQAWRETSLYNERERAALAWAESVTQLGAHGVPDDVYAQAHASFGEEGLVNLTMVVVLINAWNRLAIPFRAAPGSYQPAAKRAA